MNNFRFKKQSNGSIYAFDSNSTNRLGTYKPEDEAWAFTPNPKVTPAEGIYEALDTAFEAYITADDQPDEDPEEAPPQNTPPPPAPPLDPISGTATPAYMEWAGKYLDEEKFATTYQLRADNPRFIAWAKKSGLTTWLTRAKKISA